MKSTFLLLVLFVSENVTYGQELNFAEKNRRLGDSLTIYIDNIFPDSNQFFDAKSFDRFSKAIFTNILFEKEQITQGSSIDLVTASNETRLNITLTKNLDRTMVSGGVKLNYSNNIGKLFSKDKFDGNASYFLNISILSNTTITYRGGSYRQSIINKRRNYLINKRAYYQGYSNAYLALKNKEALYNAELIRMDTTGRSVTTDYITFKSGLEANQKKETDYESSKKLNDLVNDNKKKIDDEVFDIAKNAELLSQRTSWWAAGIVYTKVQYQTFDSSSSDINKWIGSKDFDKLEPVINWNLFFKNYRETALVKNFYLTLGYSPSNDNNYSGIELHDITYNKIYSRTDTTIMYQIKQEKLIDISKVSFKNSWAHTFSVSTILGFVKSDFWALSLAMSAKYTKNDVPKYNPKVGFVLRFKKTTDDSSIIAFEIFGQLQNAFEKNYNDPITKKLTVGINTKVPLNKLML